MHVVQHESTHKMVAAGEKADGLYGITPDGLRWEQCSV